MPAKKNLRIGFSTGAAAAASAKAAAAAYFLESYLKKVTIHNPDGKEIDIPIAGFLDLPDGKGAVVIKDAGDDPDVTHGLEIIATITASDSGAIKVQGGPGVGMVTKPGLQVPVGQPAINPVPQKMIKAALADIVPPDSGCVVTISVPDGEKVARRTMNPRLGIVGGISILGTTGLVYPMSEEAYKNSLLPQIDMALAHGYTSVVLTPGRLGGKWAQKRGIPAQAVVEMSNFVGFMLDACADKGINKVLLWGHHGKLIKVAAGIFHTHSRTADGRHETFAALAAVCGAKPGVIRAILDCATTEAMVDILRDENLMQVLDLAAARASIRATEYARGDLVVGTAMLAMDGQLLAADQQAVLIGRELGWVR